VFFPQVRILHSTVPNICIFLIIIGYEVQIFLLEGNGGNVRLPVLYHVILHTNRFRAVLLFSEVKVVWLGCRQVEALCFYICFRIRIYWSYSCL